MHPFLVEELLIPIIQNKGNFPQFLSQRQSNSTNSSNLENPQFTRLSGCCYGYLDNFCDWWILPSAVNNEF